MRRIAIINQKGGVGKTTTTVNLAAALAECGRRVGVLDLDPQAHATTHLGVEPDGDRPSVYDVLVEQPPAGRGPRPGRATGSRSSARTSTWPPPRSSWPASSAGRSSSATRWNRTAKPFDFLLMDCAPSLGVLTLNALAAADEVFIPLQPHFLALHGLSKLFETTALVAKRINPRLKVTGVSSACTNRRPEAGPGSVRDLEAFLERSRGTNVPWAERPGAADPHPAEYQAGRVPELTAGRSSATPRSVPGRRIT